MNFSIITRHSHVSCCLILSKAYLTTKMWLTCKFVLIVLLLLPVSSIYGVCISGDVNGDCEVNIADIALLATQWLDSANCDSTYCPDLDDDEIVSLSDFSIVASNWQKKVSTLLISEFMASNNDSFSTTVEGVVVFPDWIEIYNQSRFSVLLDGWYLTDDDDNPTKWMFPGGLSIPPESYLIIFASEKKQSSCPENYPYLDDSGYYHTNFKLDSSGEYLALVMPDQTVAHEYSPAFPQQFPNISYGLNSLFIKRTITTENSGIRYLVPPDDSLGTTWQQPSFDDSSWTVGYASLGYDRETNYDSTILTDIESSLYNQHSSVYVRLPFTINNPAEVDKLTLGMKYDDGFAAFLNGQEIVWRNAYSMTQPPVTGLRAYWDFENDSNDKASDYHNNSGSSEDDLTVQDGSERYVSGMKGQSLAIGQQTGDVAYLTVPSSFSDIQLTGVYSIEAWINPSDLSGSWQRIFLKWGNNGTSYHFAIKDVNGQKMVSLYHTQSTGQQVNVDGGTVVSDQWQHIAAVADGSYLNIYLNGELVGQAIYDGTIAAASNEGLGVGDSDTIISSSLRYKGLIDELALWSVPLSQEQIMAHYTAGSEGYGLSALTGPAPSTELTFNSAAAEEHPDEQAVVFEETDISNFIDFLQPGINTLAIHGLNIGQSDSDFLLTPKLEKLTLSQVTDLPRYFTEPSPGNTNGIGVADLGPMITGLTENPASPNPEDPLVITANVSPTLWPIDSVSLYYCLNFDPENVLTMVDDGSGHDTTAGDGIYTTIIPAAGVNAAGKMMRWRAVATDSSGNESHWPLYVDSEWTVVETSASPKYNGTVISQTVNSQLPILHRFVQYPDDANTSAGTRCSVFYNGEFYDNVYTRIRGGTARIWPKKSYKIEFNDGHYFRLRSDLPRVDEINVNATYTDKSYVRAVMTYELQRDADMASPESFHVRFHQNGAFFSVAIIVEQSDKNFLRRHDMDDQGLYYKAYITDYNDTSGFEQKTRLDLDNTNLAAFTSGLQQTGTALQNFLFDNVNVPAQINYMATSVISQNIDGCEKNHYLYQDTEGSGQWHMIPWDLDLTFGPDALNTDYIAADEDTSGAAYPNAVHPYLGTYSYPLQPGKYQDFLTRMVENPLTREMLLRRIRTLADEFLGTSYFYDRIDALVAQLGSDVLLDKQYWGTAGHFPGNTYTLLQATNRIKNEFLGRRYTYLTNYHVTGGVGIPTAQPVNASIDFGAIEFNPSSFNQDEEYIELINNNAYAVDISGWRLEGGVAFTFRGGTIIPAGTSLYVSPNVGAFYSRSVSPKANEGNFVVGNYNGHLSSWGETLTLIAANGRVVDTETYTGNPSDQQRYLRITELMYNPQSDPNQHLEFIELKNIGPSPLDLTGVKFTSGVDLSFGLSETTTNETLVSMTDTWSYEQTDTDLPEGWITPSYNDASWPVGAALLYIESDGLPAPKNTPLSINPIVTYYFRTHFTLDADPAVDTITLEMNTVIDDGAVFYLNGQEVYRLGMPVGLIEHETLTDRSVGNAVLEGPFVIPSTALVQGDNTISVEVHQASNNSSDIVFGLSLSAEITKTTGTDQVVLNPDDYLVLTKDKTAFEAHYGAGLNVHTDPYTGFLDNGGERIKMEDYTNSTILEFEFNDDWYDITDGEGFSLVIQNENDPNLSNWDTKFGWRPSAQPGGSPGIEDVSVLPALGSIVINEVLAHSDTADDWIELHNTTDAEINIGGWFLSDNNNDDSNRMKYEIALGTSIDANSYIVFYENQHFGNLADPGCNTPFQLSENGETVYLQSGSNGILTGYYEEEDFGASEKDIAFGQYQKSTGSFNFVAMSSNTPGAANVYPRVGPIVITEIMYHPQNNADAEYVEMKNISDFPVTLYDSETGVSWRFVDDADDIGIEYHFPTASPITIAAGETFLLVKNLTAFTSEYGALDSDLKVFEWFDGSLSNGSEKPEIQLPGDVDEFETRYYIRVDRISYDDAFPWPTEPDGGGHSLTKKTDRLDLYGNDVDNWKTALPTPGQ